MRMATSGEGLVTVYYREDKLSSEILKWKRVGSEAVEGPEGVVGDEGIGGGVGGGWGKLLPHFRGNPLATSTGVA